MSSYANSTSVSVEKSKAEIERTLQRYGATSFLYGASPTQAMIGFVVEGRQIRMILQMPDRNDREFTHHQRGKRQESAAYGAWEQACRQKWRALNLVIKAKLEAVSSGITTLDDEFLSFTVLPNGSTAGEWLKPEIARAYETGEMPSMLPALTAG